MTRDEMRLLLLTLPPLEVGARYCNVAIGVACVLQSHYPDIPLEELLLDACAATDSRAAQLARVTYCTKRVFAAEEMLYHAKVRDLIVMWEHARTEAQLGRTTDMHLSLLTSTADLLCRIYREKTPSMLRFTDEHRGTLDRIHRELTLEIYRAWCAV